MTTAPPLRWGLVGASDIAATGMVPAMRRVGHEVTAVLSGSASWAREYADRVGARAGLADPDAFLARDDVDAVYVSSTNDRHHDQVLAAAAAGKHVLCEKPLALTLDECAAMTAACARAGVVLAVNHHLPAASTHRAIRDLVAGGAVGRPLAVAVTHATLLPGRLRDWRLGDAPGAGAVMDLTVHDASVVNALLGTTAVEATALVGNQGPWAAGREDVAMAVLRHPGEVLVRTHDAFTSPYTPTTLEVHGDEGSIRAVGVLTPEPEGTVWLTDAGGTREHEVPDRRHPYDLTLAAFTDAVHGAGRPVVDGTDGARALAVALAVLESARTGTRVPVAAVVGNRSD
ncbi:Gfo/Idh/MocA family protein [Actinomycetospora atypica]|uniref:Gfo/Idh/MocA family protein n=1 Tax=Actinomycetospora atypica TaxID=1290095 RepID=A0ABV9YIP2_9PSEU